MLLVKKIINKLAINILNIFDYFHKRKIFLFLKETVKLKKIDIFFDIGAHKGETTEAFSKNFNIDKIYAFEASEENFRYLKKKINTKNKKIILENIALGIDDEKLKFNQCIESSSSTFSIINENSKYFKKKLFFLGNKNSNFFNTTNKATISLKKYMNIMNINEVDLIKIDTEGFEFNILKGLGDKIKKIKNIFFEHHYDDMIIKNYTISNINDLLKENNFKKIYKARMPFRKSFEYIYQNKFFYE